MSNNDQTTSITITTAPSGANIPRQTGRDGTTSPRITWATNTLNRARSGNFRLPKSEANISISTNTHLDDDIMYNIGKWMAPRLPALWAAMTKVYEMALDEANFLKPEGVRNDETLTWAVEDAFEILDAIAPDGYYFGSHPGDGSDYGFWAVQDDGPTELPMDFGYWYAGPSTFMGGEYL